VAILRVAYSAELAAYIAYLGHERSVRDAGEKAAIRRIGREELVHRREVGLILAALGAPPSARRERWMPWVGRIIWLACRVGGWFWPMYGAWRLERGNVEPYVEAARLARAAGRPEFVETCLAMAEVEWDHERWFHARVASHWLSRWVPMPAGPGPREAIREAFGGDASPASADAPCAAPVCAS
jgi:hypothetical protein